VRRLYVHALARLIQDARATDPSLTYARIAELTGGAVTGGSVGRWANPRLERLDRIPTPEGILGLAKALNMPPLKVLLAAAESAGVDVSDPDRELLGRVPHSVTDLPLKLQEQVVSLLRAVIETYPQMPQSPPHHKDGTGA
jgi:hypothetical protein